jgi:hypothetical protein
MCNILSKQTMMKWDKVLPLLQLAGSPFRPVKVVYQVYWAMGKGIKFIGLWVREGYRTVSYDLD